MRLVRQILQNRIVLGGGGVAGNEHQLGTLIERFLDALGGQAPDFFITPVAVGCFVGVAEMGNIKRHIILTHQFDGFLLDLLGC